MADAHGCRSAGNARKIVVFGQPKPSETGSFDMLGQIEGIGERVGRGEAFADIGQIENREVYHEAILAQLCCAAIRGGRSRPWRLIDIFRTPRTSVMKCP